MRRSVRQGAISIRTGRASARIMARTEACGNLMQQAFKCRYAVCGAGFCKFNL
jgi:hypothetical protein